MKLVPEGIEGQVPYKGRSATSSTSWSAGVKAAMGYTGSRTIAEMQERARFHPHHGRGPLAKAMCMTWRSPGKHPIIRRDKLFPSRLRRG
jgi:hypothetical protein